jgi:hypothetical protein
MRSRLALVPALIFSAVVALRADVIDRIMAVVDGQPVTLSDVVGVRQFELIAVPAGTPDPLAYLVDRLVERSVILTEVERFQPPEPDPVAITVVVDDLQRRVGSAAEFDRMLSVTGMTRDQLRRFVRDDQRITIYLNQRFGMLSPQERVASITGWIADLRRRADVTVLYRGR